MLFPRRRFQARGSAIEVGAPTVSAPQDGGRQGLATAIKAAVKTLIPANGTYGAILAKWGVSAGSLPTAKIVLDGATS